MTVIQIQSPDTKIEVVGNLISQSVWQILKIRHSLAQPRDGNTETPNICFKT